MEVIARLTVFIWAGDPSSNRNISLSAMVNAQWKDVGRFSISLYDSSNVFEMSVIIKIVEI